MESTSTIVGELGKAVGELPEVECDWDKYCCSWRLGVVYGGPQRRVVAGASTSTLSNESKLSHSNLPKLSFNCHILSLCMYVSKPRSVSLLSIAMRASCRKHGQMRVVVD